jgi:hypothetical protein
MGLQIRVLDANTSGEIDAAFATIARERPGLCPGGRPTVLVLGMQPHPLIPNRVSPIFDGFFPPVAPNKWCRDWEHNEDVA